eukprot:6171821-Pyramimonas_sp.AAC.1
MGSRCPPLLRRPPRRQEKAGRGWGWPAGTAKPRPEPDGWGPTCDRKNHEPITPPGRRSRKPCRVRAV